MHKPSRVSPLEFESLKKQLSEAYAKLRFIQSRRAIHKTPQTEMDLTRTNQLIAQIIDVIKPNMQTPSRPQLESKGTQTETSQGDSTETSQGTSTETSDTEEEESEEMVEKRLSIISYYIGDGQDSDEQVARLEERIGNMSPDEVNTLYQQLQEGTELQTNIPRARKAIIRENLRRRIRSRRR